MISGISGPEPAAAASSAASADATAPASRLERTASSRARWRAARAE
jgi:hypothetical protein